MRYDTANSITGTLAAAECVIASGAGLAIGTPLNTFVYAPSIIEVVPCVPEAEEGRRTPIRGTNSLSAVALNEVATWFPGDVTTTGGAPTDLLIPNVHVLADGDLLADRKPL